MPKKPDAKNYPLLIKIEPCPKTNKPEPCSEECTKQCLEKSYTIFDPKPPRKRRSTKAPEPPVIEEVEPPRAFIESSSSDKLEAMSSGNVTNILSPEALSVSSEPSRVATPSSISPILSEVIKSETVEEVQPSSGVVKTQPSPTEPSQAKQETPSLQKPEEPDAGCSLEILILEKHNKKCGSWKSPEETTDWLKDYTIISHHAVNICQGQPPPQLPPPEPPRPPVCVCEQSTNVNKFSSCPVCSRCPCHGRQIKTGYASLTESEPPPPSEPLSISNLSEPDTFVESVSSAGTSSEYIPDFKKMPIVRQPQEKKYPFFVKCFVKKNKRSGEKASKTKKKMEEDPKCPQCPEPPCLNTGAGGKHGK